MTGRIAPNTSFLALRMLLAPLLLLLTISSLDAQEAEPPASAARGSLVEDRAARKLIDAGDARYEAEEMNKAVEVWKSVIERYPRSRVRFVAHMRLGDYYLDRDRAYDRARTHFEAVAVEENRDDQQRAEATLKTGVCYYHARNYGKCFQVMRLVIEEFPVSEQVNQAYYYIGLGHFQLAHYSRAIAALEKVGTTLGNQDEQVQKLEAGKRLFLKIEDADLAVLNGDESIKVLCRTKGGDEETVDCFPVGRNVRLVLGSIGSRLGPATPGDGVLDVRGGDEVLVTYTDSHTADKQLDRKLLHQIPVVGDGVVTVTDGAFRESLRGVVLGKTVNVRIADADGDLTDNADQIKAVVEVWRPKTDEELEAEVAAQAGKTAADLGDAAADNDDELGESNEAEIERFKPIDKVAVILNEAVIVEPLSRGVQTDDGLPGEETSAAPAEPAGSEDKPATMHTGVFVTSIPLVRAEQPASDDTLQALPGDEIRVIYLDEKHRREGVRQLLVRARCLEGNIGGVRVTKADISDIELRIQTQLKTADALTQIGNRYKEFGLKEKARDKYRQALEVCEEIAPEARKLRGSYLENTYVQLWKIYYEMDNLSLAAAMCQRLQNEFPSSGFVDDALLQLGEVAQKQGDYQRAIGVYARLVNMKTSQLRGEAQFHIAECYAEMAGAATGTQSTQLFDRAFQEYKKVFDRFPDSGRVGDAVAKMANFYYQKQDYVRAIDTFETVLSEHPDAKYLDLILFNYGRCLYRMGRKAEAQKKFDQLIGEFPESPLAEDAKKISDALTNTGS